MDLLILCFKFLEVLVNKLSEKSLVGQALDRFNVSLQDGDLVVPSLNAVDAGSVVPDCSSMGLLSLNEHHIHSILLIKVDAHTSLNFVPIEAHFETRALILSCINIGLVLVVVL